MSANSVISDMLSIEDLSLLRDRLAATARYDPTLRAAVGRVGAAMIALAGSEEPSVEPSAEAVRPQVTKVHEETAPPAMSQEEVLAMLARTPILPPRLADTPNAVPIPRSQDAGKSGRQIVDLQLVEQRCRLKAQASQWAATRQRKVRGKKADFRREIAPHDKQMIDRARAIQDCQLWMCSPQAPHPVDVGLYDELAACYVNAADAIALVQLVIVAPAKQRDHQAFAGVLHLLAEAQSALRVAVDRVGYRAQDSDQNQLFQWLDDTTHQEEIYVKRHMLLADAADPQNAPDLAQRIGQMHGLLTTDQSRHSLEKKALNRIDYHVKKVADTPREDHAQDWRTILSTVAELIHEGLPPSSVKLRDLLMPVVDAIPAELEVPPTFRLVMREIDAYLTSRDAETAAPRHAQPTDQVRRVAEKLVGRKVFLIGGLCRPQLQESIRQAFGLDELIWFDTAEHMSISIFEPYVHRAEVALVLLAIRWSSHSYSEIKQFCDAAGKPLVRLPAGYNANQIAHQVIEQAIDRL